jgi:transcriptional regulator with XRE-family HTH domain
MDKSTNSLNSPDASKNGLIISADLQAYSALLYGPMKNGRTGKRRPARSTKAEIADTAESFGQRLRRLRESRGFSQEQFGREINISQRMIAYYENHAEKAPAHYLTRMAEVLSVSVDELIGFKPVAQSNSKRSSRLWHKLRQIESLPDKDRKQVIQLIDTLLEKERLRAR